MLQQPLSPVSPCGSRRVPAAAAAQVLVYRSPVWSGRLGMARLPRVVLSNFRMDLLVQMATFVKVVEAGKLSAAAKALRLSLPAVSRQISALEERVGGSLLLRTTRTLALTEGGRCYY